MSKPTHLIISNDVVYATEQIDENESVFKATVQYARSLNKDLFEEATRTKMYLLVFGNQVLFRESSIEDALNRQRESPIFLTIIAPIEEDD